MMTVTMFDLIAFSIVGALIITMTLGIVLTVFIPALDRWSKRYFIALFSLMFLCAVTCFLALIFWYDPSKAVASTIIYLFEGVFLVTPVFMPTLFLLHYSGEKMKNSVLFRLVTAVLGIYFILLTFTLFTDVFYYVTPDNHFFRGQFYAFFVTPLAVCMILNTTGLFFRVKKLPKKYFIALLIYSLYMTTAILIHMFYEVEVAVVLGMALFALVSFGLILLDNMDQYMHQQREIANQRANVMVLQMRPHFIYNTMMTFYYLCKQDSDKAQQVTLDFTNYLRNNFAAIASEEPIPFADELKHTQAYLAVEQAQHEGRLFVEYDTPHTLFRVPPLTLQPLVENAVKHGMDPTGDPLHIYVKTRKTNSGSEIVVENDGPGFVPANDNEPHIALNNIRQRLEMMCKGKLEIQPREGGGTSVKVTIPAADK